MQLSDIQQRVQDLHGDTAEVQITIPMITNWANDAQLAIVEEAECLQGLQTQTSVAGTRQYALPVDYLRVRRVEYNEREIARVTLEELDTVDAYQRSGDSSGEPNYYYEWSGNIYLYPTPDESGKEIVVMYLDTPATLVNASDTPEIPAQYHPDIVKYCLAQARKVDEEFDEAQNQMNEFNLSLADAKAKASESGLDSYHSVRTLEGDLGYGW